MKFNLENLVPSKFDRVVAAEPGENGKAVIFIRNGDKLEKKEIPFHPFMLLSNPAVLNGSNLSFEIVKLKGDAVFCYIAKFANTSDYENAIKFMKKSTGFNPTSPSAPFRLFNDETQQLLTSEQFRLFRNMTFSDTRRLQFDIETLLTEGFEFPNPDREGDKIAMISFCDNTGWEKVIVLEEPYSEKELLEKFVATITERDPDIIEGHNIFRFDLPFIHTRAKRHKVKLNLGRDGSATASRPSRVSIAERTVNYTRCDIYGRHIIDTYFLAQLYDITYRELEDYGLKSIAKHFGVAAKNRTYIEGDEICSMFHKDREQLKKYALDDVRETRAIAEILSPSYFYQTQLVPYSYQNCTVRGNATRIDSMLVAAYLEKEQSIPVPEPSRSFSGALTEAFMSGVFENVWHCDIRSLYPSIILAESWVPNRDPLKIFPFFLSNLREFRLMAKDAEKTSKTKEDKDHFYSLQTTFKILINSFYGYLGFSQGTFNDYTMAEAVTGTGRDILSSMVKFLKDSKASVIEIDTDGIYFQPPSGVKDPDVMKDRIQKILPKGIEVELDSIYPSMFCYKSKNYAVLSKDGEISMTGAALKSRGLEPFQREYMKKVIAYLLKEDFESIGKMTSEFRSAIADRKWPIAKFAKSETLQDSLDSYKRGIADGGGKRSAAYELAIKSGRDYRAGDQVSFYVTGSKKNVSVVDNSCLLKDAPASQSARNENTLYYLAKLDELYKKFSPFIPKSSSNQDEDPGLGL
jgi:DNA polymerase elongation subunit (family B)